MRNTTKTERIYFKVGTSFGPAFVEQKVEFDWHMGMSWQVRQRSSISMHNSILKDEPDSRILEVSTKSLNYDLGKALSAFNLKLNGTPVENIFQSSKVFNDGGPYVDLLSIEPAAAKKDPRISTKKNLRTLISFEYNGTKYAIEPKSFFYDYIYISALASDVKLSKEIGNYNIFTDIEFNQKKPYSNEKGPFNCQARSCAIYVWLIKNGLLEQYLKNPDSLIKTIYPHSKSCQVSLFNF